jgi:predicted RNA binding protein YcfA (HicA-like mRNA interferase family)
VPKIYSGKLVIKILSRRFGFSFVSQRGSHVKLQKVIKNKTVTTIIPTHKELLPGTLKGALDLAEVEEKEFRKFKK